VIAASPEKLLTLITRQASVIAHDGIEAYEDDTATRDRYISYLQGRAKPSIEGQGGDNNAFLVAAQGRDLGLSPETTWDLMLKWWNPRCTPPWDAEELQVKVGNAYRYARGALGSAHPSANFTVVPTAPTDTKKAPVLWFDRATFIPAILASEITRKHHFLASPIDEAGVGVRLHIYEGGVFKPTGADVARRLTHKLLGAASKPDRIEATVALIKESSKVATSELNSAAMNLLNVQNGMLDWRTGELKSHSPEYRSTFQIAANFIPGKRSRNVDEFLAGVFPQDALLLAEELFGYLLLPSTKFHKAIMFLGVGRNGKSTTLSMLTALLGEDCVSNVSLQDLVENRFAAAELQGKLVNIYADLPSSSLEQSSVFKAIVGGDTIKAERKNCHPFKLVPMARLLFSANELPKSADRSPAYFERWIIIPFPNRFLGSKANKDLLRLLTTPEARSALLNRAVDGLQRLEAQQDFTVCASVQEAGQTYRMECDPIFKFISEYLDLKLGSVLSKAEVYKKYSDLIFPSESAGVFNKRVTEAMGVIEKRMERAGRFERVWSGLAWKTEPIG
jgi:putative DNA primase/helicase